MNIKAYSYIIHSSFGKVKDFGEKSAEKGLTESLKHDKINRLSVDRHSGCLKASEP